MHLALIAAAAGALAAVPSGEVPQPTSRDNQLLFQPEPGTVVVSYTRAFSESWAVTAGLGVEANLSEIPGMPSMVTTALGGGLDLGLTRYLVSRAPSGPWMRMRMGADYQTFAFGLTGGELSQGHRYAVRGAVLFGFTAILEPGFTIQLAAGPELLRFFQQVDQPAGPASSTGWNLQARTELGVGWSF